jgi:ankyrin repeat protein
MMLDFPQWQCKVFPTGKGFGLANGSGVDVNIADMKGRTALLFAASKNKPLAAKALLDLRAAPF